MSEVMPQWMKTYIRQEVIEEGEERHTPTMLLDSSCRGLVWCLCNWFSTLSNGVMGQACTLLERVIAKHHKMYACIPRSDAEWHQMNKELTERMPLLASVCIALVTKMLSSERHLTAKNIQKELIKFKYHYTLAEINTAEIDIMHKLNFYVPSFTNVQKATSMATDVGMTGAFLDAVALVTEVIEYFRSDIHKEIIALAISVQDSQPIQPHECTKVRHVHLVAGCVVATGLFLKFPDDDPLPRLCILTQCSKAYLKSIGDVIHHRLIKECDTQVQPEQHPESRQPAKRPVTPAPRKRPRLV